jgi:hypothetical protein
MLLCWPIANAIFFAVKVKKYREIIYIGDLFNITLEVELSPRLFEKLSKHIETTPILFSSFLR